jgi:Protein-L-isoaspartate carboxylmethyltransferase
MDFEAARYAMVEGQVRTADVTRPEIVDVMRALPREPFLPRSERMLAYADLDPQVGEGRRMLAPRTFAKLLQAAGVRQGELVLDVGCATGYSAVALARLAGFVSALEENAVLADQAAQRLAEFEADSVALERGPLVAGAPGAGPYDVIVLEGGVEVQPQTLLDQLREGGRMVGVFMKGPVGSARRWRRTAGTISCVELFEVTAPVLPGFDAAPAFSF